MVEDAGSNTYGMAILTADSYLTGGRTEKMRIKGNGNVGIGTTNPDAKLTVNGTIHTKEVKVDLSVPGPDYVFESAYKLPKLNELKEYLDKNHHLPEIPSSELMAKEGLNLGEMNVKLLKKVEELTLYLIEKDNELEIQKQLNRSQEERLKKVEQQMKMITKKSNNK